MTSKLTAFLSVLAMSAAALPAMASEASFKFNQDQLETSAGTHRLYNNLATRAQNLCTSPGIRPIAQRKNERQCTQDLIDGFVEEIDDSRLTKIHALVNDTRRFASRR